METKVHPSFTEKLSKTIAKMSLFLAVSLFIYYFVLPSFEILANFWIAFSIGVIGLFLYRYYSLAYRELCPECNGKLTSVESHIWSRDEYFGECTKCRINWVLEMPDEDKDVP